MSGHSPLPRSAVLRLDIRSNVIWLADTNYRIDLDNAAVRAYAEADDFDPLIAADQVCISLPTIATEG